jgi:anti-sigma regulatory factor (Ser/Thr protein kinase)
MGPSPSHPAESPMTLEEQLPSAVESVAAARRAVRGFAADLEVDVDGIALAVSEAVANVVAHADEGSAAGVIELSVTASRHEIAVVVRDRDCGRAARASQTAGFGIEIIRRLAQHVALDAGAPGVALTMRFRRGGPWSAVC